LGFGRAPELREITVSLKKRLLNQVRGIDLALKPAADLIPGQQAEVIAIPLQQASQRQVVAGSGQAQEPLGIGMFAAHPRSPPRFRQEIEGQRAARIEDSVSQARVLRATICTQGGDLEGITSRRYTS